MYNPEIVSDPTPFIHYAIAALSVGTTALSVGIGQGYISAGALTAIDRQPAAHTDITKTAIIGMALIETAALIGALVSLLVLVSGNPLTHSPYTALAEIGMALAICIPGITLGFVSAIPARAACTAIARQPFFGAHILRFMLITVSLLQTPIIFGFVVALGIQSQAVHAAHIIDALRLIGAGLSIGLGSIGPALGLSFFAREACRGIGINPRAYNKIFSFTLVSEAIIETPIIFSLVISLILLSTSTSERSLIDGIAFLAAAIATGLGTLGPGISSGAVASTACARIALQPSEHSTLSRMSIFGQGLIETSAIYAVLISIMLIFFR